MTSRWRGTGGARSTGRPRRPAGSPGRGVDARPDTRDRTEDRRHPAVAGRIKIKDRCCEPLPWAGSPWVPSTGAERATGQLPVGVAASRTRRELCRPNQLLVTRAAASETRFSDFATSRSRTLSLLLLCVCSLLFVPFFRPRRTNPSLKESRVRRPGRCSPTPVSRSLNRRGSGRGSWELFGRKGGCSSES